MNPSRTEFNLLIIAMGVLKDRPELFNALETHEQKAFKPLLNQLIDARNKKYSAQDFLNDLETEGGKALRDHGVECLNACQILHDFPGSTISWEQLMNHARRNFQNDPRLNPEWLEQNKALGEKYKDFGKPSPDGTTISGG